MLLVILVNIKGRAIKLACTPEWGTRSAVVAPGGAGQHDDGVLHQYRPSLLTCGMFDRLTARMLASKGAASGTGRVPGM